MFCDCGGFRYAVRVISGAAALMLEGRTIDPHGLYISVKKFASSLFSFLKILLFFYIVNQIT